MTTADSSPPDAGVTDGPAEGEDPDIDTDSVGPDGTRYDKEATEEAERKMRNG